MLTYQQYEKAVFDWLMAKREKEPDFTFSTRIRMMKGAESDYFIGNADNNYFGFTLWRIPVQYPGSTSDLIDFRVSFRKFSSSVLGRITKKYLSSSYVWSS